MRSHDEAECFTTASQSHLKLDIDRGSAELFANMGSISELRSALHAHGEHVRDVEVRFWATRRAGTGETTKWGYAKRRVHDRCMV